MFLLPQQWRQQPQRRTGPSQRALASGLTFLWNAAVNADEARLGVPGNTNSVSRGIVAGAVALVGNGSGNARWDSKTALTSSVGVTVVMVGTINGADFSLGPTMSLGTQFVGQFAPLVYASNSGADLNLNISGGGYGTITRGADRGPFVATFVCNSGVTNGTFAYLNLKRDGAATHTLEAAAYADASTPSVGYSYTEGGAIGSGNSMSACMVFNRPFGEIEAQAMNAAVMESFAPQRRVWAFSGAALADILMAQCCH